jgi:hypothetical protein
MAGHAALDRSIGVQIPAPQPFLAPVAQLDRASDFGSEGWGFKSLRAYETFFKKCQVKDFG